VHRPRSSDRAARPGRPCANRPWMKRSYRIFNRLAAVANVVRRNMLDSARWRPQQKLPLGKAHRRLLTSFRSSGRYRFQAQACAMLTSRATGQICGVRPLAKMSSDRASRKYTQFKHRVNRDQAIVWFNTRVIRGQYGNRHAPVSEMCAAHFGMDCRDNRFVCARHSAVSTAISHSISLDDVVTLAMD
jgi:hypothetical protein